MRERNHLEADIEGSRAMSRELADTIEIIELGEAEDDQELIAEAEADLAALERLGAERLRPAAGRVSQLSRQDLDHRVGQVEALRVRLELFRVHAHAHQLQGEVTHHL